MCCFIHIYYHGSRVRESTMNKYMNLSYFIGKYFT